MRGNNAARRRWWNDESCLVTSVQIINRLTAAGFGGGSAHLILSATIHKHVALFVVVSGEWHRRDWLCKHAKQRRSNQLFSTLSVRTWMSDRRGHDSPRYEDISSDWRGDKSRVEELRYLRYCDDVTASRLAYTLLPRVLNILIRLAWLIGLRTLTETRENLGISDLVFILLCLFDCLFDDEKEYYYVVGPLSSSIWLLCMTMAVRTVYCSLSPPVRVSTSTTLYVGSMY